MNQTGVSETVAWLPDLPNHGGMIEDDDPETVLDDEKGSLEDREAPVVSTILLRPPGFAGQARDFHSKQDALRSPQGEVGLTSRQNIAPLPCASIGCAHALRVAPGERGQPGPTLHRADRHIGLTDDLKGRLAAHNAGRSPHTSKFKPWRLVVYIAFECRTKAAAFERYLKAGSGHAFAQRRLW